MHLAGFSVYAVASPAHHAYLRSLGATALFDYRPPTAVEDIIDTAKGAGQRIRHTMDVISEAKMAKDTAEVLYNQEGMGANWHTYFLGQRARQSLMASSYCLYLAKTSGLQEMTFQHGSFILSFHWD
jgi:hypothetical protein